MNNITSTENGDKAYNSSGNYNLDFFVRITRNAQTEDIITSFINAWRENKKIAIKNLLNMRDIRNGKGEKTISYTIMILLKHFLPNHIYVLLLEIFLGYGCWKDISRIVEIYTRFILKLNDDLQPCVTTTLELNQSEIDLYAKTLLNDYNKIINTNENDKKAIITLCGKWSPREKSHFDKNPIYLAKAICNSMSIDLKSYRKILGCLNRHLNTLEMLMSTHNFEKIDFSQVPSIAIRKMKNAFSRNTNANGENSEKRKYLAANYKNFLSELSKNKTKVNIKGVQPHELVEYYFKNSELDLLIEQQWTTLINNVKNTSVFNNVTAIVDVSSSMNGQPMIVAIALGLIISECTTGIMHGQVITFSDDPQWFHVIGNNLKEKIKCIKNAQWSGSTNLKKVFDMILKKSLDAKLSKEEMIKTLFIFTDMQFNAIDTKSYSTLEYAKKEFNLNGYDFPQIICWNLRTSSSKSIPCLQNDRGIILMSGFSSELLKHVIMSKDINPSIMMDIILESYNVPDEIINCNIDNFDVNNDFMSTLHQVIKSSKIKSMHK